MINVNVKMLNGDILSISHKLSKGFREFVRTVYDTCPHIPYGCLVLKRILNDDQYVENVENVENVEDVKDRDQLFAFVDISLVQPFVECGGHVCIPLDEKDIKNRIVFTKLRVKFCSNDVDEWGEPICYNEIDVFYDDEKKMFSLTETFQAPTPHEASYYHRLGMGAPYRPTEKTIWFPTIHDCLLSIENARFPRDEKTLTSIRDEVIDELSMWLSNEVSSELIE